MIMLVRKMLKQIVHLSEFKIQRLCASFFIWSACGAISTEWLHFNICILSSVGIHGYLLHVCVGENWISWYC